MKLLSRYQKGVSLALLSGMFYGFLGYFGITIIGSNFTIANMLFWRFALTTLTMLILIIPEIKSLRGKQNNIMLSLFLGALFYSSSAIFYFTSSRYVGTGIAMVMYFAYPIFVILINFIIYKNKITNSTLLAMFLLTASMLMLVDASESMVNVFGLILGLFAALSYALYIVANKRNNLPVNLTALTVSLGSASTCLAIALLDNNFAIPNNVNLWMNILGISVICTTLPILFLLHALKYISSEKASLLSITEPLFIIIISTIFLDEKITVIQILGIALALVAVFIALINNPPEAEQKIIS